MRLEYQFPNIPELKKLSIIVENKDDINLASNLIKKWTNQNPSIR